MKKTLLLFFVLSFTACSFSGSITTSNEDKPQTTISSSLSQNSDTEQKLKNVNVSKVQITSGNNIVLTQGDKLDLVANVLYEDNTRDSAVTWSSSDNTIVAINSTTGAVSGVKDGLATVLAISIKDTGKKSSATVTVKKADVVEALTKITPKEASIKVGETVRLDAKIQMSDGTFSPNVVWKSDNTGIALVSGGLVTAIAEGTTTITAIASGDSTKKAMSKITVIGENTAPIAPSVSSTPIPAK